MRPSLQSNPPKNHSLPYLCPEAAGGRQTKTRSPQPYLRAGPARTCSAPITDPRVGAQAPQPWAGPRGSPVSSDLSACCRSDWLSGDDARGRLRLWLRRLQPAEWRKWCESGEPAVQEPRGAGTRSRGPCRTSLGAREDDALRPDRCPAVSTAVSGAFLSLFPSSSLEGVDGAWSCHLVSSLPAQPSFPGMTRRGRRVLPGSLLRVLPTSTPPTTAPEGRRQVLNVTPALFHVKKQLSPSPQLSGRTKSEGGQPCLGFGACFFFVVVFLICSPADSRVCRIAPPCCLLSHSAGSSPWFTRAVSSTATHFRFISFLSRDYSSQQEQGALALLLADRHHPEQMFFYHNRLHGAKSVFMSLFPFSAPICRMFVGREI